MNDSFTPPSAPPEAAKLRLYRDSVGFLIIDFQEKLAAAMPDKPMEKALSNLRTLQETARVLQRPLWLTEQYPKGLGTTVPGLGDGAARPPFEKLDFSCTAIPELCEALRARAIKQVVLAGMETHICVLQSAVGLLQMGLDVWVVQDACVSREKANWKAGLQLSREAGAHVAPTEAVLFWLLQRAGTLEFKRLSPLIK